MEDKDTCIMLCLLKFFPRTARNNIGFNVILLLLFIPGITSQASSRCDAIRGMDEEITEQRKQDCFAYELDYNLFETNNYNPLIRPVINTTDSLTINFTLALKTIINVDSKNQIIITNVWLQMNWHDFQLVWNPADYGNITETRTRADKIWVPDIVLFNNADGKYEPSFIPNVVVSSNGNINFIPPSIYTSSCTIDVEYFPFDQQKCFLKFGSWTFLGKTLRLKFHDNQSVMDLTNYNRNGAWDIIRVPGYIKEINDTITGERKDIIIYELVIRRKTLFYTVNLIIPCFLHAIVCLCVFVLPADGCEKMTLTISVLVSLVVFLVLVQKILPPSMKIPLIAKYFLFTFIMNVLEILVTVTIIFANHKSPRTSVMPNWVCWLLLYKLPKFLLMERPEHDERWQPKSCAEPPSYPSTPQIPRASNVRATPELKQRTTHDGALASPVDPRSRENNRVNSLRKDYKLYHGSGSSTRSSMGSGSHMSVEDSSTSAEVVESLCTDHSNYPLPPFNGHRCMLRETNIARSDDTLDENVKATPETAQPQPRPFWLTKEIYSGVNAVKFIWRQMQNKEEYETVLDDWKYVAAVLDRLLMIIFVLVTLGGTLGVLVNAPYILDTVDEEETIKRVLDSM